MGAKGTKFERSKLEQDIENSKILSQNFAEVKSIKAEFVRSNLLTRRDLMTAFRPPVKKTLDDKYNPFVNKAIFSDYSKPMTSSSTRTYKVTAKSVNQG